MASPHRAGCSGCTAKDAVIAALAADNARLITQVQLEGAPDKQVPELAAFTVEETAEHLHVSRDLVYDLIRTRQLRSVKLGRRRVIPAGALRAFLSRAPPE